MVGLVAPGDRGRLVRPIADRDAGAVGAPHAVDAAIARLACRQRRHCRRGRVIARRVGAVALRGKDHSDLARPLLRHGFFPSVIPFLVRRRGRASCVSGALAATNRRGRRNRMS
ncbi:hypothetical protein WR25_20168 [Diploscapter pachys]|uniref:Uncharacterized protein n=1 Tax=Diploscapter pachys TaxID=2018661 RepID=A0A2A2K5Z7_9BILA|nr:hypothetical protein WR25_20168 [Diploscapter pachys]